MNDDYKPRPIETKFNFRLTITADEDENLIQTLSNHERDLSVWVCRTRDKQIREALMAMGWTPPD